MSLTSNEDGEAFMADAWTVDVYHGHEDESKGDARVSTVANGGDGLNRMVQNPKRYFAEARRRAAAQVDAEMKRSKQRSTSVQSDTGNESDQT